MWFAVTLLLLVLYPLSMGPAMWLGVKLAKELGKNGFLSYAAIAYEPLLNFSVATGTADLLEWYINLFTPFGFKR